MPIQPELPDRLSYARLLVAVGELARAEREALRVLDATPEDVAALTLLAKIKHMRGELTEAVACWAQTHGRSRHHAVARMHLLAMLELARDPERGAGEFVAVGQFELARKPKAYLELDAAYRLFLARRPADARLECKRVALKHRATDRDLFKLAVLADALFAELSGDDAEAARVLEELGRERGFEGDLDRVMTLVTLYERVGTPAELAAALHICRYIERTHPEIPILGRMAALHRRLGDEERASHYDELHLASFERRMHRVPPEEAMLVASERYVPIAWLTRARWPVRELKDPAGPFERALWQAVRGGRPSRFVELSPGAGLAERKYAAELALRDGRESREIVVSALRDDPADLQLLELLLGGGPPPEWLLAVAREPGVRAPAERVLRDAVEHDPRSFRAWRALARVSANDVQPERAQAMLARASALEVAAKWRERAVGRVLAAAVYRFVGRSKGLIHEVWVDRRRVRSGGGGLARDAILGNVTDEMKTAILGTFVAVREYARARFPHLTEDLDAYEYSFRITKDDEPSSGTSAGLPTALAFLSTFLDRPVPQDLAFTGVVVADAHDVLVVRRVGDVEPKVKGAYDRNVRAIVVPEDNREELLHSHAIPARARDAICRYVASFDDAVRIAFGDDELP